MWLEFNFGFYGLISTPKHVVGMLAGIVHTCIHTYSTRL